MPEEGKKLGMSEEKVDALEAQLKPSEVEHAPESILQRQYLTHTKKDKNVSTKKERKRKNS